MYDEVQARLIGTLLENKLHFPQFRSVKHPNGQAILAHYDQIIKCHQDKGIYSKYTGGRVVQTLGTQLMIKGELLNILSILQEHELFIKDRSSDVNYKVESIKNVLAHIEIPYKAPLYVK